MERIVMVLGSPNDERSNLSDIAIGRAEKGIEEYRGHPGSKLLCTGGFGPHFNTTSTPHAEYIKKYLAEHGVPSEDILQDAVPSRYTVEDAVLAKPVVDTHKPDEVIVVTSDFHMMRVMYIFDNIFKGYQLSYSAAPTDFSEERYKELYAHEEREMQKLLQEGLPN